MKIAICIRCGFLKHNPSVSCHHCHFKPQSDEDLAKSLILSLAYEIDGNYRGKTKDELNVIATTIQKGCPYVFDDEEVQSVIKYALNILSIPSKQLTIDGLRWLLPPITILIMVFFLLFWTR